MFNRSILPIVAIISAVFSLMFLVIQQQGILGWFFSCLGIALTVDFYLHWYRSDTKTTEEWWESLGQTGRLVFVVFAATTVLSVLMAPAYQPESQVKDDEQAIATEFVCPEGTDMVDVAAVRDMPGDFNTLIRIDTAPANIFEKPRTIRISASQVTLNVKPGDRVCLSYPDAAATLIGVSRESRMSRPR